MQIIFRGFEGLDHLKVFVMDCLESTVGKIDTNNQTTEVKVILGTTHHRHLGQPPEFLCETLLKTKRRTFFTKKIDQDFYASVKKCMKALSKNLINSNRSKREKHRSMDRHQSIYDFNMNSAEAS